MKFHRALVALGVAGLNLAAFGILHLACDAEAGPGSGVYDPPSSVALTVGLDAGDAAPNNVNGPTGSTFLLTIRATSAAGPVEGLPIALTSQPSGVLVNPTTVTTDQSGLATAYAFVPYDVHGVVVAIGGGSAPAVLQIQNDAVQLTADAGVLLADAGADASAVVAANAPTGTTFLVSLTAVAPPADNASSTIPGMTVNLTAQPSGVTVSPATLVTNDVGQAAAFAFVPYATQGVVVLSATGAAPSSVNLANPPVALQAAADAGIVDGGNTPSGTTFEVTVSAQSPLTEGGTIEGFPVTFTAQPSTVTVSPATVNTNSDGQATTYVFVPYDTAGSVLASGTGALPTSVNVGNPPVALQGVDAGIVDGGNTPSGTTFQVIVSAQSSLTPAGTIEGFPVSFTTQPSSVTVSPATVNTNGEGQATTYVFVPYNTQGFVLASGTGADPGTIPVANSSLVLVPSMGTPTYGPGGETIPVYMTADSVGPDGGISGGVAGVTVSFTAQAPATIVSSSTVTTDLAGQATAYVLLPYNTQSTILASAGGSLVVPIMITNTAASLVPGTAGAAVLNEPTGSVLPVTVDALVNGGATDGGPLAIVGLPITYTVQAPAVLASPAALLTNADGAATAYVFLPYNSNSVVVATAGSSLGTSIPVSNTAALVDGGTDASVVNTPTGSVFPVTVDAVVTDGAPIMGLPITYTVQPPAVLASPATLPTDNAGAATAYVFLPYDSNSVVVATAGSSLADAIPISNLPVSLDAGSPPSNAGDAGTSTGQYWFLSAAATANMLPVSGLTLIFTPLPTGMPASTTVLTDMNGNAAANIFAPWGSSELVMIAGAGTTTWVNIPSVQNPKLVGITLPQVTCGVTQPPSDANIYSITATAETPDAGKSGVSVSFTVIAPTGDDAPVAVPATATTDSAGNATTVVAVPSGGYAVVVVSEGSYVWECDLPSCTSASTPCVEVQDGN